MSEFEPICISLVLSLLVSVILLGVTFLLSSNSSTYPALYLQKPFLFLATIVVFIYWIWIFYAPIFLEGFFLTLGPVELVPSDLPHFPITNQTEVLTFAFLFLLFLVAVLIHLKKISKEVARLSSFEKTCFFGFFFFLIIHFQISVAHCDINPVSPAISLNSADPEIPPEPDMPQGAPGHEIQHPIPVPPDIPRLDQPLIGDQERFIELQQRFQLYYLGRNEITDLAGFAGRLERAVPIERNIEAALVFDGFAPDRIRGRITEIRGILFTHPTRMLLLSEHTLARDLTEIQTNGTRQSAPYLRLVRAIRNANLLL